MRLPEEEATDKPSPDAGGHSGVVTDVGVRSHFEQLLDSLDSGGDFGLGRLALFPQIEALGLLDGLQQGIVALCGLDACRERPYADADTGQ